MEAVPSGIPGCVVVATVHVPDERGHFTKLFQADAFRDLGVDLGVDEVFVSRSAHAVVRGLHFQVPPRPVAKVVACLEGEVLDAVVDLRVGSPTFGEHRCFGLSGDRGEAVVVPVGCAHGFVVRSETSLVAYAQEGAFDPACDAGIRWDSAGINWGVDAPTCSPRDAALPRLADFASPFRFGD